MCHFITAYVPRESDIAAVESAFDQNKFGFRLLDNLHVQRQLDGPVIQILTTRKTCDCGTSLASVGQPLRVAAPTEREIDKLRQKGWSEWRIRRSLAQKAASARRQEAAQKEASIHNAGSETERWVRVIAQILQSRAAEWVGVLVHKYRRGLVSERIVLEASTKVRVGKLTQDTLLEMKEDAMMIVRL